MNYFCAHALLITAVDEGARFLILLTIKLPTIMDNQISLPTASAEIDSIVALDTQFFYPSAYVGNRQAIQKDARIDAHSLFSSFTADIITSDTVFTR